MSSTNPRSYFAIRNDLADTLLKGSHQLAGVPEGSRGAVLRTALDAVPEAAGSLRAHPVLYADGESSASRLAFSCLSAAATFPDASLDRIAHLGALTVILFGVDDLADGTAGGSGTWSEHDLSAFFARLAGRLTGEDTEKEPGGPAGQVVDAWTRWCADFRGHPGAAVHAPVLARQLLLAGDAMARERAWSTGRAPWPSYDDYLPVATISFLYHAWWAAALAVCGPAHAHTAHWTAIEPATGLGASCLRLANDLRSFERERAEGKPNAISILERAGLSTAAAVARVAAHADELEAALRAALARPPAELAPIARAQLNCVAFNGRWYRARDTHAYTVRELAGDADAHRADPR